MPLSASTPAPRSLRALYTHQSRHSLPLHGTCLCSPNDKGPVKKKKTGCTSLCTYARRGKPNGEPLIKRTRSASSNEQATFTLTQPPERHLDRWEINYERRPVWIRRGGCPLGPGFDRRTARTQGWISQPYMPTMFSHTCSTTNKKINKIKLAHAVFINIYIFHQ